VVPLIHRTALSRQIRYVLVLTQGFSVCCCFRFLRVVKQPTRRTLAGHWGQGQHRPGCTVTDDDVGWSFGSPTVSSVAPQAFRPTYSSSVNCIQLVVRKFRRENEYQTTNIRQVITYIHCIRSFVKYRTPPHTAAINPHQSIKSRSVLPQTPTLASTEQPIDRRPPANT
jgi:hypothetical protein